MEVQKTSVNFRETTFIGGINFIAIAAFVSTENINQLFVDHGFGGKIGVLSIDIDGVDYWVWDAISCVDPAIVIVEYNSLFGAYRRVTVPYRADFDRRKAHYSCSYYGASLAALVELGTKKGFSFVGCNSAGNNAFFVRNADMVAPLRSLSPEEGYVKRSFREMRDKNGAFQFPDFQTESKQITHLELVNIDENRDEERA